MVSSGVNIDCNYIINVKQLMKKAHLPRPARKYCKKMLTDCDGEYLPIIKVTIGVFEWQNTFIYPEHEHSKKSHNTSTNDKMAGLKSEKELEEY